jgi:hypothetical protein
VQGSRGSIFIAAKKKVTGPKNRAWPTAFVEQEQPPRLFAAKKDSFMCDYSLHNVASRPAKVGDKLTTARFPNSITRGFAAVGEPDVAVCLLPGTELAFEREVEIDAALRFLPNRNYGQKVARFRQVNLDQPATHHDALEFPNGQRAVVTQLCEGQHATVLQLPASARQQDGRAIEQRAAEEPLLIG